MPSHKEILQQRYDDAARKHAEAAAEAERVFGQVKSEREAIAKLNLEYEQACRQIALGKAADTASIAAERDRRTDRLTGLEALRKEAEAAVLPLHDAAVEASRLLQAEVDREELQRLEAEIVDARSKRDAAEASLRDAEKILNAAGWARSQFLRQQELKAKARA